MNFRIFTVIIFSLLSLFSCKRADDAWNEIRIKNSTNDTILFVIKKKGGTENGLEYSIIPNDNYRLANATYTSDFGIIRDNWGNKGDTIEIYRYDTLLVKWGGPLRYLPDSIHSFYNERSWVLEDGGQKNKYVIATFTITEEDF